jgi:hypothetical protein
VPLTTMVYGCSNIVFAPNPTANQRSAGPVREMVTSPVVV